MFIELAAAVGLAAPATLPPVPARPAGVVTAEPAAIPARQVFTWRWTDGSKATERIFRKSTYGTIDKIPKVAVKVYPAYPPWKAKLLFWVNGDWVTRQTQRSDSSGRMFMSFDPRGPAGTWENVTWIVRIKLKDISTTRSVPVTPRQANAEVRLTVRYVDR